MLSASSLQAHSAVISTGMSVRQAFAGSAARTARAMSILILARTSSAGYRSHERLVPRGVDERHAHIASIQGQLAQLTILHAVNPVAKQTLGRLRVVDEPMEGTRH